MTIQPLFAADLIQTIIGIVVFILWGVGQYVGSREEAKRKKKAQLPRPKQPQPANMAELANRPPKQGPRNQEEALRSEVEDFLRRAQGKPTERKPTAPKPDQPPLTARRELSEREPTRRESTHGQPQPSKPVTQQQARTLRTEGVAEHVQRHLNTGDIAEHSMSLGAEVANSDDRLELRLHEKFDHDLGKLGHRDSSEVPVAARRSDVAAEVAAMLRSPQGMRQLIVASEILRRPEW